MKQLNVTATLSICLLPFFTIQAQTIKTIKPAGGGDYTTLAAWEDWADGQTNAAQWAECYSGGDLGTVDFGGWASTPNATNYPRIYVPLGEGHGGSTNAGAYTTSPVSEDVS